MEGIERVFDRLDRWRCLPDYQLERRADLFFSLYVPEILEDRLHRPFRSSVVPEFPIKQEDSNRSDKADYLGISSEFDQLVLVELKTDRNSVRSPQFEYLIRGARKDARTLLRDLDDIRSASRFTTKYDCLLDELEQLGLTTKAAEQIGANHPVVLIAPDQDFRNREPVEQKFKDAEVPFHVVDFEIVRRVVVQHHDPISQRFAESLRLWLEKPV